MTARTFLVKGLIAGFIAGILAFGVAFLVGEPSIDAAIAIEESNSAAEAVEAPVADHEHAAGEEHPDVAAEADGHSHGDEAAVSRDTQSTWGLATATIVVGTALGGVIALAAAFAVGRFRGQSPRVTVGLVAAIGFVSFYLVPFLKYPPNPPAVGNGDTIGARTAKYATMVAISVIAAIVAVVVAKKLSGRMSGVAASGIGALGYGVVVLVTAKLLAPIDEVPATFPPELLYSFRLGSVAVQATLWATLGLVLAGLIQQAYHRTVAAQTRRELADAL